MLDAGEEMSRLGLFPKTTKLVAQNIGCEASSPLFRISTDEFRAGLFPDIEKALTDHYTTGNGLGLGLGGARRLVNEFDISSRPGEGTRVMITRWK